MPDIGDQLDAEAAAEASGVECITGGSASTLLVVDVGAAASNLAGCRRERKRSGTDQAHNSLQRAVRRVLHGFCYV